MSTYSFLNVTATLVGPGCVISLGAGAGASEEGLTVEMVEEKDDMKVGAGGEIMHSLRASKAGRFTVRLLKTSAVNAALSKAYNFQASSAQNWGQNQLTVSDVFRGDVISGDTIAFARQAPITWAKDANFNEWLFQGRINMALGAGVPDVNVAL